MRRSLFAMMVFVGCVACDGRPRSSDGAAEELALLTAQSAERERVARERDAFARSIESILAQDANAARIASFSDRAAVMRHFDLTGCPPDFGRAYVAHVQAWELAGQIQRADAEISSGGYVAGAVMGALLREALNDDGEAVASNYAAQHQRLAQLAQKTTAEINATFREVERIAAGYGARLPAQ